MSLVSVVVPCHDLGSLLEDAVDSVFAQSRGDFEILVVDDGSTEPETRRLLQSYDWPRTRVITQPVHHPARALAAGLASASGDFLVFLDPRCALRPTYLERALRDLEADPALAVVTCWVEEAGGGPPPVRMTGLVLPDLLVACTVGPAALARRSAVLAAGGIDESLVSGADAEWDLWIRLAEKGLRSAVIPDVLVRRSGDDAGDGVPERGDDLQAGRRLIDKHADAYAAHRLDVVAGKDALLRAMTTRNDSLARHVDVLTTQRDRLRRESAPPLAPLVPTTPLVPAGVPRRRRSTPSRGGGRTRRTRGPRSPPPATSSSACAAPRAGASRRPCAPFTPGCAADPVPVEGMRETARRAATIGDMAAREAALAAERRRSDALEQRRAGLEREIAALAAERVAGARGVILVYHRVSAIGSEPGGLSVTPADFRAHLAHLAGHYRPLSLDALVHGLGTGALPDAAVAVTLDDGYLDALEMAAPILDDLGVPATFFCTTARLADVHELWWDTLERALIGDPAPSGPLTLILAGATRTFPTETAGARREAHGAIAEALRGAALPERERALEEVARWHGKPLAARAAHRALTASEIQDLSRHPGHSIGAHSTNHLALPGQPADVRAREIGECRGQLESLLQREVTAFAYPYGAYDDATVEAVRDAGLRSAVTVEEGLCRAGDDPLRLPRVEVRSSGVKAFAARLERLFASARSRVLET